MAPMMDFDGVKNVINNGKKFIDDRKKEFDDKAKEVVRGVQDLLHKNGTCKGYDRGLSKGGYRVVENKCKNGKVARQVGQKLDGNDCHCVWALPIVL